ncbi:ribonuclease H-like domain-containing protein [Tanacetum coccineum]
MKKQYSKFKAEGSETLEQTFNRLQAIVSHLEFMDVPIKKDDLNQKFLTSLALEWLMYTIVWRNRDDLDTMSLDDLYNHLKVYEPEVQNKAGSNSQNMAFVSSSNTSSGKGEVPTATTQSSGSQIKYEDITQIDEDDIKEIDIKWNLALLSMRADRWNASIAIKWVILLESAEHQEVKTEEKEKVTERILRIRVLERDVEIRDNKIESLKNKLEELKKEKESIDHKLAGFGNASKDLNDLLESQKSAKDKTGVGFNEYSAVPPPPAQVYSPPKKDLSWTGLPEFVDDTVTDYTRPTPSVDVSKDVRSDLDGNNTSIFEQGETSGSNMSRPMIKFVKESGCPNAIKINNTENTRKPTVKYAEMYRDTSKSPKVRGNQRNWNNLKSQQLGKDFLMQNKACYKCGYFDHLASNCGIWVAKGETWPRGNYSQNNVKSPSTHKSMTPRAVLLKSGSKPIVVNKPKMNVAQPTMTSFKTAHSNVKRPFERKTAAKNQIWVPKVPTGRTKIPTVGSNVPTAKPTGAADLGNKGKAVKASARWIWKPKENTSGQGSNFNGGNIDDKGYWDSGCSRHMTGNISYLSEYEPYDGGYVSFGHGGGKITGKGTIKTGKLEFKNVYFMKELKYNLFSVSQICDNKNSVLFTDLECLVLGKDFKAEHVMKRLLWCIKSGITSCCKSICLGIGTSRIRVAILEKTEYNTDFHQIVDFLEASPLRRLTKRAIRIAQSKALPHREDKLVSPLRDDSHGEAFPTATSLDAGQDRENIPKTSAMPYESSPRVTSLGGDEGRAANILASGGLKEVFTTASPPVPPVSLFVPTIAATASEMDSTAAIITTTTAVTPYTRRTRPSRGVVMASSLPIPINIPSISKEDKRKGIMTEPAKPTKQKVQEQMSKQLARELEEEFAQENQRLREQAAKDAEIARLYTE